jgi:hypothetical protein
MSMALVDRTLRARELGEDITAPAQDEEFVMSHSDNVQATGFVEHLKLPHYVDFQSELGSGPQAAQGIRRRNETPGSSGGRGMNRADIQLRLSGRADQADDPPRHAQGDRHPRLSGALRRGKCRCPMAGAPAACRSRRRSRPRDKLKVIDQGADDTTNAISIRKFFEKTAGVAVTTSTGDATIIQTRHRIPEATLTEAQVLVYQVPIPEPLRFLEPRETETGACMRWPNTADACEAL